MIGDYIAINYYDDEMDAYTYALVHAICEDISCINVSQNGTIVLNPDPELDAGSYFVSLFDVNDNELSYVEINVVIPATEYIVNKSDIATNYTATTGPIVIATQISTDIEPALISSANPVLPSIDDSDSNLIKASKTIYAPGESLYIEWNLIEPMIGDYIAVNYYDDEMQAYTYALVHAICEDISCLNVSQNGTIVLNPDPELVPGSYFVSLFDVNEIELSYE